MKPLPAITYDPISGIPVPEHRIALRLAIENGCWKENNGYTAIDWKMMKQLLHKGFPIPSYTSSASDGLKDLMEKMRTQPMLRIDNLGHHCGIAHNFKNPEAKRIMRQAFVHWVFDRQIPVYVVAGLEVVFAGDFAVALESCRIDQEEAFVDVWRILCGLDSDTKRPRKGRQKPSRPYSNRGTGNAPKRFSPNPRDFRLQLGSGSQEDRDADGAGRRPGRSSEGRQ